MCLLVVGSNPCGGHHGRMTKKKICKVKLSTWECVGRSGARQISQKSTKKQGAVAHSLVYCQRSIEDPSQQSQLEIAIPDSKKIAYCSHLVEVERDDHQEVE